VSTTAGEIKFDGIIGAADYHHIEQNLLESEYRQYTPGYWDSRVMAPSSLLFYVGVNKKIENLDHHNLFFDADYDQHASDIYETLRWPANPLFYVCCPSVTDSSVAPAGMENLFILMPLAPGINDEESVREKYFEILLRRIERHTGEEILSHIIYKKSYCVTDFISDYNAYKGNAYGLANTLRQTAILKPKMSSRKVKNLFYAGQLTVPGPGVPPSIISGEIASDMLIKHLHA
jgi:phytoene desaturase